MPDELDDLELDPTLENDPEGGDPEAPEEPKPQYVTKEDFDALRETLTNLTDTLSKRHEPAPVKKEEPADNRTPWEIAAAEAEAQSIYSEEWKYQRALQIQAQQHSEELKKTREEIVTTIGGMIAPTLQDRIVTKVAGGNAEIAAEIQKLMDEGVVDAAGLQNEAVAATVRDAAELRLQKRPAFHGAAPNGGNGRPILNGLRAQLNADQLADLKATEARYGKFTDEMIAEAYGIMTPAQRN